MNTITIPKKELESVVKESVREVLGQEWMKLRALAFSPASKKEQKDIEKLYGNPKRKAVKTIGFSL